ncbi:MAG: hypothetical protein HYT50_02295 [Candidatus Wildermuthbacteria bacterium]|nr:hypothetical protein [Candidatus Wildermuthbacteria bacterium]
MVPQDLGAVVDRVKKLHKELERMLRIHISYMAGDVSFLEFFWSQNLNPGEVNQALDQLLEANPDLSIKFQGQSGFPPMGI